MVGPNRPFGGGSWSYLGTVVGGRRGVENRSAGGGIRILAPRGGKNFVLQEGDRGGMEPKKLL